MNKKEELQAQRNELFAHSSDTLARIKELDENIQAVIDKEAEEVFSVGDRFIIDGKKRILVQVGFHMCAIVTLTDGNRWNDPVKVKDCKSITQDELELMVDVSATRYYDARKKKLVGPRAEEEAEDKGKAGKVELRHGDYNIEYGLVAHVLNPLQPESLLHWRNHKGIWNAPYDDKATVDGNIFDDIKAKTETLEGFAVKDGYMDGFTAKAGTAYIKFGINAEPHWNFNIKAAQEIHTKLGQVINHIKANQ